MRQPPCFPRFVTASLVAACAVLCFAAPRPIQAQDRGPTLSEAEVEKLREVAPLPPERIMVFLDFLNQRAEQLDKLSAGKRKPGREEDIHDLMQQMTGILDDLDDNLDEYSKRHNDVRKALPKLIAAAERWATVLRSPPEDQQYSVQRKLALESLNDVHQAATQMIPEQAAWFKEHPPAKSSSKSGNG
jgi:hypothetical protein